MMDKYYPQDEIKKLEIELWNLKVKENNVSAYTERFQELTLICTKFVNDETEKIDKYISGLPDNIYGSVKASKPKTLDETIEVYNMGTGERKPYSGNLPKCTKCHFHHNGPCTQKCHKCNKVGHFARDCRSSGNANVANAQRNNGANPKGNGLGSFDVIIDMDWLRRCHAVIVCDEKLVQIPYGNETFTFRGNESNNGRESRLTVISCLKAQEYMAKGCQIFLAQISAKKEEDRSEGKQLEEVPVIRDYPEVFPKDFLGLPPVRPVEF
nr:putative reverse transcriptase domain-containing protein [Tanacetum cinerariifolium]